MMLLRGNKCPEELTKLCMGITVYEKGIRCASCRTCGENIITSSTLCEHCFFVRDLKLSFPISIETIIKRIIADKL